MKTKSQASPIYLTKLDHDRLLRLVQLERQEHGVERVSALSHELKRAHLVAAEDIFPDVVTMNSRVRLREVTTSTELEITLVYPQFADIATRKISILAPVATAVLGCRIGDTVHWSLPKGRATYRVEALLSQPAAASIGSS